MTQWIDGQTADIGKIHFLLFEKVVSTNDCLLAVVVVLSATTIHD